MHSWPYILFGETGHVGPGLRVLLHRDLDADHKAEYEKHHDADQEEGNGACPLPPFGRHPSMLSHLGHEPPAHDQREQGRRPEENQEHSHPAIGVPGVGRRPRYPLDGGVSVLGRRRRGRLLGYLRRRLLGHWHTPAPLYGCRLGRDVSRAPRRLLQGGARYLRGSDSRCMRHSGAIGVGGSGSVISAKMAVVFQ